MPLTVNDSPFERDGDGGWTTVDAVGVVGDGDLPPHPAAINNKRAALQQSLVIVIFLVVSENGPPQSDPTRCDAHDLDKLR
jgi:hypothetical protein